MSIATLFSQHNHVTTEDIIPEKVDLINWRKPPIQDEYIKKYLVEKKLNLTSILDAKKAYSNVNFAVIAALTNYDSQKHFFDSRRGCNKASHGVHPKSYYGYQIYKTSWLHCKCKGEDGQ